MSDDDWFCSMRCSIIQERQGVVSVTTNSEETTEYGVRYSDGVTSAFRSLRDAEKSLARPLAVNRDAIIVQRAITPWTPVQPARGLTAEDRRRIRNEDRPGWSLR